LTNGNNLANRTFLTLVMARRHSSLPEALPFDLKTGAQPAFVCGIPFLPFLLSSLSPLSPLPPFFYPKVMLPRAAPGGDRGRGRSLGRGRGHGGREYGGRGGRGSSEYGGGRGRGRGGSEYGGGDERGGCPSGSEYGNGRGRGSPGAGRGRARSYRGVPRGGADRGAPRGRGNRGGERGVVVEASSPIIEAPAGDVAEAGSYPLFTLPTLSSGRTGPLPAEHVKATGVKRQDPGTAGRVIKLRSNHVEVKLDLKMLCQYDGMYLSYSWEDK
jgi:hypothetical protein